MLSTWTVKIDQGLKRSNIQSDDIQETSDFIEAALAEGGKVVVNCWGGGQEGVVVVVEGGMFCGNRESFLIETHPPCLIVRPYADSSDLS